MKIIYINIWFYEKTRVSSTCTQCTHFMSQFIRMSYDAN